MRGDGQNAVGLRRETEALQSVSHLTVSLNYGPGCTSGH